MKTRIIVIIALAAFLSSCATSMQYTWTKPDFKGEKFDKVLVMVISQNLEARTVFENTVVSKLGSAGVKAQNSLDLFPPILNLQDISEEDIESTIKSGNFDAVLVTSLINVNEKDVYEQGNYYHPVHHGYRHYIHAGYGYAYSPGYYREEKTYVLESRLFKIAGDEGIVWSGQSSVTDPSSYSGGAHTYANALINTLLKSEILK